MFKKTLLLFVFWRLSLFVPLVFSELFIPYRQGYSYTSLLYFLDDTKSIVSHFLFLPWANFDGVYYMLIAANGYTVNAGFFPLFPLSIHLATSIFANIIAFDAIQYFTVLTLVSLYFLLSLMIMHKLIRIDYKENIAVWSIVFMLLFPTSFFFAAFYSESLFLLLTLSSFYFARRKRWILAGVCGGLLTATRLVGIAIIPALVCEFIKSEKTLFKKKSLYLLIAPLGTFAYMWFNLQKWGNAFYFIEAQGNLQNNRTVDGIVFIPQTIFRYFKIISTVSPSQFEWFVALLEITTFVFVSVLLYVAWKKKIRFSYLLFAVLAILIPTLSGTFSGLPRYSLVLFPIFIALALLKNKVPQIVYLVTGAILLFILFMLFSKGYYIA